MAISLQKGGNVSLSKEAPGMQKMLIGLGWDVRATDGADFDLDGSAFLLNASGKVRSDADFIFYNQPKSADGSVVHTGDNRTGEGEGDDEAIIVELNKVPADVEKSRRTSARSLSPSPSTTPRRAARTSARFPAPLSAASIRTTAPKSPALTSPKMPR